MARQPGAAGVVTNNLVALGAQAAAIGYTGQDGNGFTLRQALKAGQVSLEYFLETPDRFTPTYTKPMMREVDDANIELNRMDLINRSPNPESLNQALAETSSMRLRSTMAFWWLSKSKRMVTAHSHPLFARR